MLGVKTYQYNVSCIPMISTAVRASEETILATTRVKWPPLVTPLGQHVDTWALQLIWKHITSLLRITWLAISRQYHKLLWNVSIILKITLWCNDTIRVAGPLWGGIYWSPVVFPHKRPATRTLMFSLVVDWTNGWINRPVSGDLGRDDAYCDVIVLHRACQSFMKSLMSFIWYLFSLLLTWASSLKDCRGDCDLWPHDAP